MLDGNGPGTDVGNEHSVRSIEGTDVDLGLVTTLMCFMCTKIGTLKGELGWYK